MGWCDDRAGCACRWLPDQFDMLLHADVTRAILPLDVGPDWITVQEPAS